MEDAKPSAEETTVEGEPAKNPDGTMEVEDDVDYVEHDIDIMRHPGTVHVIEENQYWICLVYCWDYSQELWWLTNCTLENYY